MRDNEARDLAQRLVDLGVNLEEVQVSPKDEPDERVVAGSG